MNACQHYFAPPSPSNCQIFSLEYRSCSPIPAPPGQPLAQRSAFSHSSCNSSVNKPVRAPSKPRLIVLVAEAGRCQPSPAISQPPQLAGLTGPRSGAISAPRNAASVGARSRQAYCNVNLNWPAVMTAGVWAAHPGVQNYGSSFSRFLHRRVFLSVPRTQSVFRSRC